MLSYIQDQMNSFLLRDTANEGKQRHVVVQLSVVEVLHLQGLLGSDMVWRLFI